LDHPYLLF